MGDLRPADADEEDMQLQLALQLSKQEHDAQERLEKQEEMKLQMAIEASRKEHGDRGPRDPVRGAQQDLLGLSLAPPNEARKARSQTSQAPQAAQSSLVDLGDPWARPARAATSSSPWDAGAAQADPFGDAVADPFGPAAPQAAFDPFANAGKLPRSRSDQTSLTAGGQQPAAGWKVFEFDDGSDAAQAAAAADPFQESAAPRAAAPEHETPEFDVLNYRMESDKRKSTGAMSPPTQNWDAFDESFGVEGAAAYGGTQSPLALPMSPADLNSDPFAQVELSAQQAAEAAKKKQKTPQEFLGDNAKLVNFDALVAKPPPGTYYLSQCLNLSAFRFAHSLRRTRSSLSPLVPLASLIS